MPEIIFICVEPGNAFELYPIQCEKLPELGNLVQLFGAEPEMYTVTAVHNGTQCDQVLLRYAPPIHCIGTRGVRVVRRGKDAAQPEAVDPLTREYPLTSNDPHFVFRDKSAPAPEGSPLRDLHDAKSEPGPECDPSGEPEFERRKAVRVVERRKKKSGVTYVFPAITTLHIAPDGSVTGLG